jgi:hypothetical protein
MRYFVSMDSWDIFAHTAQEDSQFALKKHVVEQRSHRRFFEAGAKAPLHFFLVEVKLAGISVYLEGAQ